MFLPSVFFVSMTDFYSHEDLYKEKPLQISQPALGETLEKVQKALQEFSSELSSNKGVSELFQAISKLDRYMEVFLEAFAEQSSGASTLYHVSSLLEDFFHLFTAADAPIRGIYVRCIEIIKRGNALILEAEKDDCERFQLEDIGECLRLLEYSLMVPKPGSFDDYQLDPMSCHCVALLLNIESVLSDEYQPVQEVSLSPFDKIKLFFACHLLHAASRVAQQVLQQQKIFDIFLACETEDLRKCFENIFSQACSAVSVSVAGYHVFHADVNDMRSFVNAHSSEILQRSVDTVVAQGASSCKKVVFSSEADKEVVDFLAEFPLIELARDAHQQLILDVIRQRIADGFSVPEEVWEPMIFEDGKKLRLWFSKKLCEGVRECKDVLPRFLEEALRSKLNERLILRIAEALVPVLKSLIERGLITLSGG